MDVTKRFALFFTSFVFCASGVVWAQTATSTPATTSPSSYSTESSCTAGGAKWCKNSDGASGWCTSTTTTCPAYDEASCSAQSGQWCKYQSSSGGWCATGTAASCPINDEPTCTSKGRTWCKSSTSSTTATPASSGWCANTGEKCPANDEPSCKAQGSQWCKNQSGGTGWCMTSGNCPAYDDATCKAQSGQWCGTWCATGGSVCPNYNKEETDCTTKGSKWCKNSDGATGWCMSGTGSCPAYDSATCKAQGGDWCQSTGTAAATPASSGWCATGGSSCPISDESSCTSKGRSWCKPQGSGGTGWCTTTTTEKCPAYDDASCKAQNGQWCGTWCATGSSTCPNYNKEQTDCTTKGSKWCKNSDGLSGWCSSSSSACPAYDDATCKAQNGEWCKYTSGTGGWCASGGSSCPINDEPTCTSKGRSWCKNSAPTTAAPAGTPASSGWCANTGEKCSSVTTPPPTTFTWPQGERECTLYKGRWCMNNTPAMTAVTGYCQMATMVCPSMAPDGKMTCWDGSFVSTSSSCPQMPTTEGDCTKMGKNWCKSPTTSTSAGTTAATSGWCSKSSCMAYPPQGMMTCPDGVSFGKTITDCPKGTETLPEYDFCPNNIKVLKGVKCPVGDEYTLCADGTKVAKGTVCPSKEEQKLTDRDIREIDKQKKRLLSDLSRLEKAFTKINDTETLAKVAALKAQIDQIRADSTALDSLQRVRDDVDVLDDLRRDKESAQQSSRDKEMQKKALEKLQKGLVKFDAQLLQVQKRIQTVENKKTTVSQDLKDAVAKAQTLVATIRTAVSYDEAVDAIDSLRDQMESINDLLPKLIQLEQAPRLSRIVKFIQSEIAKREKPLKAISTQAKRAKVDVVEELAALTAKMQSLQTVLENIKNGEFGDYAPSDYIKENIFVSLQDIDNDIEALQAITGFKSYVAKLEAQSLRYTTQIRRVVGAEKKTEATALLKGLKSDLAKLKTYKPKEINQDNSGVFATLAHAIDTADELDALLGLLSTTLFDRELDQLRGGSNSGIHDVNIPELDELSVAANHLALFYRVGREQVGLAYQKPKRAPRALAQDF